MSQTITCYKCGKSTTASSLKLAFSEECGACKTDLHACLQCHFFDKSAYNNCREPQAERVVDKEKRNYCEYFQSKKAEDNNSTNKINDALKKLDDLFK